MVEEAMSTIDAPQWTILEDRLAGRAWIVGIFKTRSKAKESFRPADQADQAELFDWQYELPQWPTQIGGELQDSFQGVADRTMPLGAGVGARTYNPRKWATRSAA